MRVLAIGIGDCGSRLAGEFTSLNKKARSERRVQIITNAYAVNNDKVSLESTKARYRDLHTLYVNRTISDFGGIASAGAELMREEGGRILTGINPSDFYDTDAILLIAGSAGVIGSGGVPVMIQMLKDRHIGKPIYALIVLPFESDSDNPQYVYNTAVCLKSVQQVTEAVFLVDNDKYGTKGKTSAKDMNSINREIVLPYYDLLCASEGVDPKLAGARTLGIGDMLQTLTGWTSIGVGMTSFAVSKSFWRGMKSFQEKGTETQKAMEAMSAALGQLSLDFKLEDSRKALYLLSVPAQGANVDMVKVLGNRLREVTNDAEIRGGDFYGSKDCAQVTLVLSGLTYVEIVKNYYDKAVNSTKEPETRQKKLRKSKAA
jgi:cell division GTPase FtsZ